MRKGRAGIRLSVEAGVDTLEHGEMAFEAPEALATMAERGIILAPTLCVFDLVADTDLFPEWMRERAKFLRESAEKTVAAARREGVAMAMGADAGPHGENARELVRLVEAGLTPMEGIVAATATAARACRLDAEIGTIAAGKAADLLVLDGDPLEDPRIFLDPERRWLVLQAGVAGRRHAGRASEPRRRGRARVSDVKDVVVVGAGIAGLTAATRLQDLDVLVLEAENRVGGRIKSERRGDYWVSVGAHMFPGPGSVVGDLVDEFGLETLPINGSLMGLSYRGALLKGGRTELYPFRLPMSPAGRVALIRTGLKLRRDAAEYNRLARHAPGETEADVASPPARLPRRPLVCRLPRQAASRCGRALPPGRQPPHGRARRDLGRLHHRALRARLERGRRRARAQPARRRGPAARDARALARRPGGHRGGGQAGVAGRRVGAAAVRARRGGGRGRRPLRDRDRARRPLPDA